MAKNKGGNGKNTLAMVPYGAPYAKSGSKRMGKKKRGGTKVPRALRMGVNKGHCDAICRAVCGQIDPFSEYALGAKIYDTNTQASFPVSFRKFASVTQFATGTGKGMNQYRASVASCLRGSNGATGPVFDTWGGAVPMPGYSATNFTGYRIVSWGVRYWTVSSPTDSAGYVGAITVNGDSFRNMDSSSTLYIDHQITPVYQCVGSWRSKYEGMPRTAYVDITAQAEGWSDFALYFDGAAVNSNQAVLMTETIINAEVHVEPDNTLAQVVSRASPDVPAVSQIAANVLPSIPDTQLSSQGGRSVWDYVSEAVESFAGVAGPLAVEALVAML